MSDSADVLTGLPTLADVRKAAGRLDGVALRTPLLTNAALDAATGGRVFLKVESLQHTGSFKFRGAYNRLVQLSPDERARGVVAFSSGNHAQGVAYAAQRLSLAATIVMPADAPAIKVANTKAYGAEVILYDRHGESREAIGARLASERGATLVPSYDDRHIIAGQGTCGLEIGEQLRALGVTPDVALVCTGGGGLIAGCALALRDAFPDVSIHPVEPQAFDDTARSLAAGRRMANAPEARSICDALLAPTPGVLTFALNSRLLAAGLRVSDAEAAAAVAFAFTRLKLVLEPGGAVALAAALCGRTPLEGRTAVVVLSGGNVDPEVFSACLTGAIGE